MSGSKKRGAVLVVGGGIGGMQAALDLADSGFFVHMVQKDPSIGGTMVMLDKTFPTGDCSMCMISPRMVEMGRHPNIKIHTLAEVESVSGVSGDFAVTVKQHPRYVDPEKCTGCGLCEEKCPKLVESEFEQGLVKRKAIYALFAQAVPNTRAIDAKHCIYLTRKRCRACEKLCQSKAIMFEDKEKTLDLSVGAIILAPGLDRYDPRIRQELGFGRWANVVTSVQFERILSASGPFTGEVSRPSDHRHPKKVAWIQCVGSRDSHNANPWCSSVCCMYATKQAVISKEHDADIEPTIFYMDMRTFGKDFDKYVERAKTQYNVRYQRAMISSVREEAGTSNLVLRYARENGDLTNEVFDMVVLSIGFQPRKDAVQFAEIFGIKPNACGFAGTGPFAPVNTSRPGIFVTGTYQGPKDIPETVMQGSAVAGSAMALLSEARGTEVTVRELPPETDITDKEARIGVFVCHCGINIAQTVDVKKVVHDVKDAPGVAYAENLLYACSQDGQDRIKELVCEHKLNRVVVASCTPRTHAPLFMDTIRDAGLNKYLFDLADIREQCAWCHMGKNEIATQKAIEITKMSVAKARLLLPVTTDSVPVTPGAMIIGGGVAGMTAALALSDQGFAVHIVEEQDAPGGLARQVYHTLDGSNVREFVKKTVMEVEKKANITVHLSATVDTIDGVVGNFKTVLTSGDKFEHGAIIVATGGREYEPVEYGYGESDTVITQRELEKRLSKTPPGDGERFAMIQCVGSREEPLNYCSRICCQDAVKNAIAIKKATPAAQVVIFYRDIRTYGLREDYYKLARDLGVLFIRFEPEKKPVITKTENSHFITAHDYILNREIRMDVDWVVLSTGLRPHPSTESVGKLLKLTRNSDGFFLEAHVKLRPVDFPSEGIYLAGLAHAPKNLDETISQALAAAGRAGALLSHERLNVSGTISKHNRDLCMSCLECIRHCPFGSPYIDEDGKVSHNEIKCTGCGICAGICPAKAYQVNNFTDNQIFAMIDVLTQDIPGVKDEQYASTSARHGY